jgi:hypothetical protein
MNVSQAGSKVAKVQKNKTIKQCMSIQKLLVPLSNLLKATIPFYG